MRAFIYGLILQWKLDVRNKDIILTYYVVPLIFFSFMGAIFSSINPSSKDTLIQSMTIFGVSMGAFLGTPAPLVELYSSKIKKVYKVCKIPLWVATVNNFLSAFIHLYMMSMIIFFGAPIMFGSARPFNLLLYFLQLAIFICVCLGIGTTLGLFVKDSSKLTMFSQLIFLPSLMLSGIMFPTTMLPKSLRIVGELFPATWGFQTMISNNLDVKLIGPLILIFVLAIIVNIHALWRLEKMSE